MDTIKEKLETIKRKYNEGLNPIEELKLLTGFCIKKLNEEANLAPLGSCGDKQYYVFRNNNEYSRPILKKIYISSLRTFNEEWNALVGNIKPEKNKILLPSNKINSLIYTSIISFSSCYDLWKPKSRKTPGTFFELILGSIIGKILLQHKRTKHIQLPNSSESISTDIVFKDSQSMHSLVIPAKITTRERIVQPYAHQRILDSVFGVGKYLSILVAVSETQRDGSNNVKDICVPGTIKLFQNHLAKLKGIYYLDPPIRYLDSDLKSIITIGTIGDLLANKLPSLL